MANPKAETESHRHQSSNIVYWPKSRCDQWHLLICACEICPTLAGMLLEELCDWAGLFLFFSSHYAFYYNKCFELENAHKLYMMCFIIEMSAWLKSRCLLFGIRNEETDHLLEYIW